MSQGQESRVGKKVAKLSRGTIMFTGTVKAEFKTSQGEDWCVVEVGKALPGERPLVLVQPANRFQEVTEETSSPSPKKASVDCLGQNGDWITETDWVPE